jgi:hypothetical protein
MNDKVDYRAYVVGPEGRFSRPPHIFSAENDDAALEHARQLVDGYDIELWSGARLVFRLPAIK